MMIVFCFRPIPGTKLACTPVTVAGMGGNSRTVNGSAVNDDGSGSTHDPTISARPPPRQLPSSGEGGPIVSLSSYAVPLLKGKALILETLRRLVSSPASCLAELKGRPSSPPPSPTTTISTAVASFLRLEVEVDDIEDETDAIGWLRAQNSTLSKVYLRIRGGGRIVAGLGAAHIITGPEGSIGDCQQALAGVPPCMVYYGGGRFDGADTRPTGPEWEAYGAYYLLLPAIELVHREGDSEGFVLTCNLRWEGWEKVEDKAVEMIGLVEGLVMDETLASLAASPPLPSPTSCQDNIPFDLWDESINKALAAMERGDYHKIVLARACTFAFPCALTPLDIMAHLRSHYGYLFCLQLSGNKAFLGCTPEQLFKVSQAVIMIYVISLF